MASISAGVATCGLKPDGDSVCWGAESVHKELSGSFAAVSVGEYHACGIRADGTVECTGSNEGPPLTTGYSGQANAPTGTFKSISAGGWHTCGIQDDDSIVCWGWDGLGDWAPPSGKFKTVDAGGWHTCGIRMNGTVECWGRNDHGETSASTGEFVEIHAGFFQTCGLKTNDSVHCWGKNDNGQASAPDGVFRAISTGSSHSCGIRENGEVDCWGNNLGGKAEPPKGSFAVINAGAIHTRGIRTEGNVVCWGLNTSRQIAPPFEDATTSSAAPIWNGADSSDDADSPTTTLVPTATAAPTANPTATPTPTATPAPTANPTATPTPTATPRPNRGTLLRQAANGWGKAYANHEWETMYQFYSNRFKDKCTSAEFAIWAPTTNDIFEPKIQKGAAFVLERVEVNGNSGMVYSHFENGGQTITNEVDLAEARWENDRWVFLPSEFIIALDHPCDLTNYSGFDLRLPLPKGFTIWGSDGTDVVVVDINDNAWPVIQKGNQFNDPPAPGNRFYMVRVQVSNVDGDGLLTVSDADFELVGDNRVVYAPYRRSCGVIPDDLWGQIYLGGTIQGNICFQVGATEGGFVLIHNPGFSGDTRFLSLE